MIKCRKKENPAAYYLIQFFCWSFYLFYVIIVVLVSFIVLLIFFCSPLTVRFEQGWNFRKKTKQFFSEFKGFFEAFLKKNGGGII